MKKRILYVIFAGIATVFFLYYLFPKETLEDYIDYQVYRLDPDFRLTIGDLRVYYPPYVKVSDFTVYYQQEPILTVSSARVRPGLAAFFDNGTIIAFSGYVHEGRFSGRINREGNSPKGLTTVDVDLDGIQLEDINGLRSISGLSLSGRVTGKVVHINENTQPDQGKADLVFSDCTFQLADAPLGIKIIRFNRIEMGLILQDRTLKVHRLEMTGSQINARFDGTVAINSPFNRSRLNLTGKVRLHAEFMAGLKKKIPAPLWPDKQTLKNGLPVSVSGTVQAPRLAIK